MKRSLLLLQQILTYMEKWIYKLQKSQRNNRNLLRNYVVNIRTFFSINSSDIRKTPLIEMEIDTGDSPPITQRPYTLPLKHATWVQKELEIPEKAGVIVRNVSPWASPIVVVPKRTAPGEPPKRR